MHVDDRRTVRLTFGDDLFVRRHRGLGGPVVNQFVWRFDRPVPTEALLGLRDALAAGALARRADRTPVPGARARWSRVDSPPALLEQPTPLRDRDVMTWVHDLVSTPLDPARGDAWRLATARTEDGGSVVSLVLSHAIADGGAMINAVERAVSGRAPLRLPDRAPLPAVLADDLRDAASQIAEVGRWLTRARRSPRPATPATPAPAADPEPVTTGADDPVTWRTPIVVAECRTYDIDTAAARLGGTPNAWFVAVVSSLAIAAGTSSPHQPLRIALPVSAREPEDLRANATRIASVVMDPEDLRTRDLARVRARCKAAYAALDRPAAPGVVPLALVQMMPDAVVRRLPQPPNAAVLASNLGTLSDAFFCTIGGVRARSVAALAGLQGASTAEVRAMGGGFMAWIGACGDRTTVSVAALDPDRVRDDATLRRLVTSTLSAWDVEAHPW